MEETKVQLKIESTVGGANRETRDTDYSGITAEGMRLLAQTCAEGAAKYGRDNWRKGLTVSNLLSHALEHIFKFQSGDVSENHLGHALWNLDKAAHFIKERPDLVDITPLRKALGLDDANTDTRSRVR